MQLSNAPGKLVLPFANAGAKNTIPAASQIGITAGAASLTDGFPPLTRTPIATGGVPPSGLDMNGILYALSAALRWANAGGGYVYDGTFAADSNVGGYPKGARVLRSDGAGYWLNTIDGNTVDPESVTVNQAQIAGWVPDLTNGVAAVTMTSANVTLTPLQYGKPIIVLSGTLTANLNLIFPNLSGEWTVVNNCTGAFTVTAKTAAGTGIAVASGGKIRIVWGDGTNIYSALNAGDTAAQFDVSTLFASTAFVKSNGVSYSSCQNVSSSRNLAAADIGAKLFFQASATLTILTPTSIGARAGDSVVISNFGGWVANVAFSGCTYAYSAAGQTATISIAAGESLTLVAESSTTWQVGPSTAGMGNAGSFVASKTTNGYQKFPSGLMWQWGVYGQPATGIQTLNFTYAFPTNCLQVISGQDSAQTGGACVGTSPVSATRFTANTTSGDGFYIFAIGY